VECGLAAGNAGAVMVMFIMPSQSGGAASPLRFSSSFPFCAV